MRMMLKVSIPVETGNRSIADGTLPKTVMDFMAKFKPGQHTSWRRPGGVQGTSSSISPTRPTSRRWLNHSL